VAPPPTIYIVCSDQHRNGKTLLARVLVDYLMLEGHDPFVIDAGVPEGPLRNYFPGRTALVDFSSIRGQMKVFDTILAAPGRDYVIDLPAPQLQRFEAAVQELRFAAEARRLGFRIVVLFIVDAGQESLDAAVIFERAVAPDLLVPVKNAAVGSALPAGYRGVQVNMEELPPQLLTIIANRHFSLRAFLSGEEEGVPEPLRPALTAFLYGLLTAFRDIPPAMSLARLAR
jgi:hypothetical protein